MLGPDRKTVITLDMALYEKARRLELLHPEYKNKYIFRVGEFRTVLCTLRAIGSMVENSGIDDAWIAADIYGPTTTRQILEGRHTKRAVNAHISTLLVFFKMYWSELVREKPELEVYLQDIQQLVEGSSAAVVHTESQDDVNVGHRELLGTMDEHQILQMMTDFTKDKPALFKFACMYMDAVLTLMSFIRATRQGLWELHLTSKEKLCCLFFARDRLKYAQMVPRYIQQE